MDQIDIVIGREKLSYRKRELDNALDYLSSTLEPNTPVLIRNSSWIRKGHREEKKSEVLFFSDGTITSDFKFGILGGLRNSTYLEIDNDARKVIGTSSDTLDKFIVPYANFRRAENIGIPGVRNSLIVEKGAGTSSIVLGAEPLNLFPEEYRAIKFAGNAIYIDTNKLKLKSQVQSENLTNDERESICIDAVLNLIENAGDFFLSGESDENSRKLNAFKISSLKNNSKNVCDRFDSHPEDYIIRKSGDCDMWLGIMKLDKRYYGDVLVLPINKFDKILETAFENKQR
jgi:hypothetical protein